MNAKSLFTRIGSLLLALVPAFSCLAEGATSPSSLSSTSQVERDVAAEILRGSYVPPSRTNWNSLMATLTNGLPQTNVLVILRDMNASPQGAGGSGRVEVELYRLDDLWILECGYARGISNKTLVSKKLKENLRAIQVPVPPGLTGKWTTYYVNGQKCGEGNFNSGRPEGESFGFFSDGHKSLMNHSVNGLLDGEETGFFPSGHVKHKGTYKGGFQVGTWTWFNEDGSVKSTRDFSKPSKPK